MTKFHGGDKRLFGKGRKLSTGLLKGREGFLQAKKVRMCFRWRTQQVQKQTQMWNGLVRQLTARRLPLLHTCTPAANARWSHFIPNTYLRRPHRHQAITLCATYPPIHLNHSFLPLSSYKASSISSPVLSQEVNKLLCREVTGYRVEKR